MRHERKDRSKFEFWESGGALSAQLVDLLRQLVEFVRPRHPLVLMD